MRDFIWIAGGQVVLPILAGGLFLAISPRWPAVIEHPVLAAVGLFWSLVLLTSLAGAGGDLWMAQFGWVTSFAAAIVSFVVLWRRKGAATRIA